MVKKILMICIGVFTSMVVAAQVTVNRGDYSAQSDNNNPFGEEKSSGFVMKYGVKAGVNMSSMSNDMAFDPGFGMGIGFRAGAFLNLRWGQRTENSLPGTGLWGFQPEVMYSNQAVKTDAGDIKLNYVSVPLLLKVYPTTALSVEVGPEFSYLLSASPNNLSVKGADIAVGDCKGLTMGLSAGLAYDLEMGLTVGARYTYGFTELGKDLKWKNSNIQVTVGWMF